METWNDAPDESSKCNCICRLEYTIINLGLKRRADECSISEAINYVNEFSIKEDK